VAAAELAEWDVDAGATAGWVKGAPIPENLSLPRREGQCPTTAMAIVITETLSSERILCWVTRKKDNRNSTPRPVDGSAYET
jgi:hypothetical protein